MAGGKKLSELTGEDYDKFTPEQRKKILELGETIEKVARGEIEGEVKKGLETGAGNYPLIIATPEALTPEEQDQTEAEYVYHKLIEPLKSQELEIWAETGTGRWTPALPWTNA